MKTDKDGIALNSVPHPVAPWWRRVMFWFRRQPTEDVFETAELDLSKVSKTGFKINKLPRRES